MSPIKPRYLGGASTLFWGFQLELYWFAIPMCILLEARYFLNRRWALKKTDFYRVADLTAIGLVGMVIFLFMNAREYHFITTLIAWFPILLFPLVIVMAYSTTPRMSLDVLFYSLRRQREPVQQSWDMDYVFLGTCLLAAGLNREGSYYFAVVSIIIIFALFQLRSSRFPISVFVLSLSIAFVSATAMHTAMRGTHLAIKEKTQQWIADWISQRTDPMKHRTRIGQVGQLKLSDSIDFRIEPASGTPDFPRLLREASYNTPTSTHWELFDIGFKGVEHADDFRWTFTENPTELYPKAKIYIEFDRDRSLVPVPSDVVEIHDLPATAVNQSIYGTIQGTGLVPAPHYGVRYNGENTLGGEPSSTDLRIPKEHREMLADIPITSMSARAAIDYTQDYFSDFRYTLYQPRPPDSKNDSKNTSLSHFMLESRAGHCEYFASATALMLRHLGVHARYVVGYSIQEWNENLQMYVVRKRHAHAWVEAYVDNQWVVVDTTPSQWLTIEENESSIIQPLWDFFSNNQFLFQRWWNDQKIEDYETELYILGFLLVLFLIWRISTSEQVIIEASGGGSTNAWILPGAESPFFKVESFLTGKGYRRGQGELMAPWLVRIQRPELLPLLPTHNRWRFDPHGVSMDERKVLADQVHDWLEHQQPSNS
jgi:transglutaminase-like putative cysteine protease